MLAQLQAVEKSPQDVVGAAPIASMIATLLKATDASLRPLKIALGLLFSPKRVKLASTMCHMSTTHV